MPAIERVRLDVLETRRNSEKPRPKARIPPNNSFPTIQNVTPASWKWKSLSDMDKGRPRNKKVSSREPFPTPRAPPKGSVELEYSPYFHKRGKLQFLCAL